MFKNVSYMNTAFGNKRGDPDNIDWNRLSSQCENIKDEYEELLDALANRDPIAVRDALCDINVFSLGAHHIMGADAEDDMYRVYTSNMSKICTTEQELVDTEKYYKDLGVETYSKVSYTLLGSLIQGIVYSAKTQKDKDGKNYPKDKFLKNVNWKEPEFV